MSRLTWGAPTERFFETGVDRGVLYVGVAAGVPWNGLVSVSESPTGGSPKPAYIDGYKFRNVASSEEFEATIEAFAAPKEFGPCDGSVSIQNGLIATQQPRRSFSLTYRTKIGNAVEGVDHGYKIHLVYNALAAPAQRNNATLSDSQGLTALSWSLTTLPPSLTGYKPTAHFIIDSRTTPKGLLAAVEDILYGTEIAAARMPLVSELITLFQSQGPQLRMNYVMTPGFRATLGSLEIRRNIHPNPFFQAVGAATIIRRNYITDPRLVTASGWTGITAGGVITTSGPYSPNITAVAGDTWTVSADITAAPGTAISGNISVGATTGGSFGSNARGNTAFNVPAGTTQRVSNTFTLAAGADGFRFFLNSLAGIAGAKVDNILAEKVNVNLPFFYGATPAANGITYAWVGSVNGSESTATAPTFLIGATNNHVGYISDIGGKKWIQTVAGTYLYAAATGVAGKFYAAKLRIAGPPGQVFAITSTDNLVGNWLGGGGNITMPAEGEIVVSLPSGPANANNNAGALMFGVSSVTYARNMRITDVLIEEVPATGLYIQTGDVFGGATPTADGLVYTWTGTANQSPSIATGQLPTGAVKAGNSADVAMWQGVDGNDKTTHVIIKKPVASQGMYISPSYVHGLAAGLWQAGDLYVSSAWVKGTEGVQIYIESAATGVGFNPKTVHTFSGDWERIWLAAAFPAGAVTSGPYMLLRSVGASQFDMQVKKVQIEDGVVPTEQFDGATIDENAYYYSWIGAADLTASVINSWHLV